MTDFDNEVRLAVYRHFVAAGRAPRLTEVASALNTDPDEVRQAFESLAAGHVLVLDAETRELWMAMPFSAVPTSYRVTVGDTTWWANCAWDALGVPAMLARDATIYTRCPVTDTPVWFHVESGQPAADASGWVHFAIPAARWWDDVGYT